MKNEEDWIVRPALEGLCKYESLIDGTLNLMDVRRMNAALDVKYENENRVREANK